MWLHSWESSRKDTQRQKASCPGLEREQGRWQRTREGLGGDQGVLRSGVAQVTKLSNLPKAHWLLDTPGAGFLSGVAKETLKVVNEGAISL